jgi:hypothetical protein
MSAAKIHRELCAVYGPNVMNEGTVRQLCIMFEDVNKCSQSTAKWLASHL